MNTDQSTTPKQKLRWYRLTPGRLLLLLLVVEGALLLSERWFPKGYAVLIAIGAVAVTMVLMLLWFVIALFFRWRFQFSIRSLLVLTVAVAIPCSWLAVEMKRAREQKEVVDAIVKLRGMVGYDYGIDSFGNQIIRAKAPSMTWMRKLFGGDFFDNVVDVTFLVPFMNPGSPTRPDINMEQLKVMKQLKRLRLCNTEVTDIGLEYLKGMEKLQRLDLRDTKVTDAGVAELQRALPNCKIVH